MWDGDSKQMEMSVGMRLRYKVRVRMRMSVLACEQLKCVAAVSSPMKWDWGKPLK